MSKKDLLLSEDLGDCPYLIDFFNSKIRELKARPGNRDEESRWDEVALILAFKRNLSLKEIADNRGWNHSTVRTWARKKEVMQRQGEYLRDFSSQYLADAIQAHRLERTTGEPGRYGFNEIIGEFKKYPVSLREVIFAQYRDILGAERRKFLKDITKGIASGVIEDLNAVGEKLHYGKLEQSILDDRNTNRDTLKENEYIRLNQIDALFTGEIAYLEDTLQAKYGEVDPFVWGAVIDALTKLKKHAIKDTKYITELQTAYVYKGKQKKR